MNSAYNELSCGNLHLLHNEINWLIHKYLQNIVITHSVTWLSSTDTSGLFNAVNSGRWFLFALMPFGVSVLTYPGLSYLWWAYSTSNWTFIALKLPFNRTFEEQENQKQYIIHVCIMSIHLKCGHFNSFYSILYSF